MVFHILEGIARENIAAVINHQHLRGCVARSVADTENVIGRTSAHADSRERCACRDNAVTELAHLFSCKVFAISDIAAPSVGHKPQYAEALDSPMSCGFYEARKIAEVTPHSDEVDLDRYTRRERVLQRCNRRAETLIASDGIVHVSAMRVKTKNESSQLCGNKC